MARAYPHPSNNGSPRVHRSLVTFSSSGGRLIQMGGRVLAPPSLAQLGVRVNAEAESHGAIELIER